MIDNLDKVIFVDDDAEMRRANVQMLKLAELTVFEHAEAMSALAVISRDFDGIIVSDVRMPGLSGMEFLSKIQNVDPEIPVILITGHGDVPMAIEALKQGASDFITKPFSSEQLLAAIRVALRNRELVLENRQLRALAIAAEEHQSPLLGTTNEMVRLRDQIALLAGAEVDVLIQGETGTGKELAANILHRKSSRRGRPFVAVNSGALTEPIAEIELFGQGSDEGRSTSPRSIGRIEAANGGTLFLDEVDSMPAAIQLKFLRVLEEREIHPVGAPRARSVDIRIIAATKIDLAQAVAEGHFRSDLYYRLNVVRLVIAPLRERKEDIPLLFSSFINSAKDQMKISEFAMTDFIRDYLFNHDWPGNVRELRNFAYQAVFGAVGKYTQHGAQSITLAERVSILEAQIIREVLSENGGSIDPSAKILGIARKTLYDKIAKHDIDLSILRI